MHRSPPDPASSGKGPLLLALVGVAVLLSSACAAPFSEMQSARLAGPDRIEVTPAASAVSFSGEDDRGRVQNHLGLHVATGVSPRTDLRLRLERISPHEGDGGGVNVLAIGPKFGLVPDQVALYLPVGFAFGDELETSNTFQIHPTLLLTLPLERYAEVNASVKALIPITERDIDDLVALNLGLGLGPDLTRWAVRPEVGILFNPGEDGHFRHFSIGFTYYVSRQ